MTAALQGVAGMAAAAAVAAPAAVVAGVHYFNEYLHPRQYPLIATKTGKYTLREPK